jgi:hypothetical protein
MDREDSIFEQDWLCSTVREKPVFCASASDGSNVSEPDASMSERIAIEGASLYGLKMAYYCVSERSYQSGAVAVDPLFGEQQLETIDRAFWFTAYTAQMPPSVRTYQLQGIWGEDVVQLWVPIRAFRYFSTYGGASRNDPETHEALETPRIGDLVFLPANGTAYQIVDVKRWEETLGTAPRYFTVTLRVYMDTKRTVSGDPSIPLDDPIRKLCSSALERDEPTPDVLRISPDETPDPDRIDAFDWLYRFGPDEDQRRTTK